MAVSDESKKRVRAYTYWPESKGGHTDGHGKFATPWFKSHEELNSWMAKHPGFHGGHKIKIEYGSAIRKSIIEGGPSPRDTKPVGSSWKYRANTIRHSVWRKRQIILPEELVEQLFAWHGGQFTPTYALASTGMRDLVSLSMIDAAKDELDREAKGVKGKNRKELKTLLGDLEGVRIFWKEHSAEESGMEFDPDNAEYDHADYGLSEEDEDEIDTHSG